MHECLLSLSQPRCDNVQTGMIIISLRFLGIILRVLRLEVSVCNVYITNQFQTTVFGGGGGGKIRQ
jgi:hypothetical protein